MKYTAFSNDFIEKKVERDIDSIQNEIFRHRKKWGVISLFLYGGFARGEGSVEAEGNNIRPLNDYDFLAVSNQILPAFVSFRRFIEELNSRIGGYKIDMVIRPVWLMKRVRPSIFYYELKKGGRVLWGEDILKLMPEIDPGSIPISDGLCTLFNRLMSLMEAYGVENRKFIVYQCNKAVLTCMEMLLFLTKRYHWSYGERLSIFKTTFEKSFPDLAKDFPEFISMAERATRFKLFPDYSLYPEEDLWEKTALLYFRILNFYIKEFECCEGNGQKRWIDTMGAKKMGAVSNFFSWLIFKLRKGDSSRRFNLKFQPYLLCYLAGYEWLKAWVEKAPSCKIREYLGSIDRVEYTDDFLDLKEKIINNWKKSSFIL